ncbi:hypothetical protein [Thiobaca trueperi]|uniref:Uncharacterized protein n=1 Tax=Thiobaca trueperi TaxID=127458 RepID=A0A4R3MYK2_9GAMM|nr:hypothetical protein [Thiobaca trueperi]TCT21475.1 hypothetical protein EDC35_104334 [Thiobaca trueperi]
MFYRAMSGNHWPCCHGDDEEQVYHELCLIVDEWIDILKQDAKPLPPMTSGMNLTRLILAQAGDAKHAMSL